MQFNVHERLLLLNSLSTVEGNLATLRVVRDLQAELSFSEEELKDLKFQYVQGRTMWDDSKAIPKEVPIGPAALNAALSMFQQKDTANQLTFEFLPLYEKLLKAKEEITPKLAAV